MDNMNLIKKLPPMLSGSELERALTILPEYNPAIAMENEAMRLIALSDLYKVYVPNQMSKEIYCKLYLALLRSLQKKQSKEEKISPYFYRSGLVMECAALCHGSARKKKENARKEKDRAAEIWKKKRRWERMREDVDFYPLENVRSYLRIYSFLKKLFLGAKKLPKR